MKVIVVSRASDDSRTFELGRWSLALFSLCCLGLPLGMLAAGYMAGLESEVRSVRGAALGDLQVDLDTQAEELALLKSQASRKARAMTLGLARLQARMTRLDALGEHLTAMAGLESGEFDFSQPPALGGPVETLAVADVGEFDLGEELARFGSHLEDRQQQLDILESLMTRRKLDDQAWLSGRPVAKGWISSRFGRRTDPFTGLPAVHLGIDFAGREGSDVLAVAAGVVTWAGTRSGYGELVEIAHDDGLVTRYAHNQENLVQPGDVVRKGETIALMGNSGRSTGAHVHFEVYKHGRPVDPSSYVARTRR